MIKRKSNHRLIALGLTLSLLISGCSNPFDGIKSFGEAIEGNDIPHFTSPAKETEKAEEKPPQAGGSVTALSNSRGTLLTLNDSMELTITRLVKDSETVTGEKGLWTVLVYICGADLESEAGCATADMKEMQTATKNCDNLRFIVEAGGAKKWQNSLCSSSKINRLLIQNGDTEVIEQVSSADMGKTETLQDFLGWALDNYQSEHMMLDFWNHGGGSINGVCFDEKNNSDSLYLEEIDIALASVYDKMSQKFDLIGCDACLMATVEMANVLVPYGRYMICSQEIEPGSGWNYTAFASGINDGAADGLSLGKYIADGFFEDCRRSGEANTATMSVVDLSKMDGFISAFNDYSKEAYSYASDNLNTFIKAAKKSLNFGGNNWIEGYTNMVDAGSLLTNSQSFSSSASKAKSALQDCVAYCKNGSAKTGSSGLSLYYPLSVQGSGEMDTLKSVCISPYYLNLVDLCAYGSSNYGDTDNFDFGSLIDIFGELWGGGDISGNYDYWNDYNDYGELNFDQNQSSLQYASKPHLNENGYYCFTLTQDSLMTLDTVYCNIMESYYDDYYGRTYLLDYGTDDFVSMDWVTGYCEDNFDGMWFALPDGQSLSVYLVDTVTENNVYSNIYTSPIYLNGKYTNLKIKQTYADDDMTTEILGAWAGIDEYGAAAKEVYQLQVGDIIQPCYYAYDPRTFEYICDYYGDEYVYDGSLIGMDYLEDADYYYAFEIYDIYGNALYSDFQKFAWEDGEVYYYY